MTYAVALGSKVGDNLLAIRRKHPVFHDKPLIDYTIVLIFLPPVLLGSSIGATFSSILPNIFLQFLMFTFISISLYKTMIKVLHQLKIRRNNI